MQSNVAEEIMRIVQILPEEKQKEILHKVEDLARTASKPSIWRRIRAHAENIPDDDWKTMPTDGSQNHDHYLYGTPKK